MPCSFGQGIRDLPKPDHDSQNANFRFVLERERLVSVERERERGRGTSGRETEKMMTGVAEDEEKWLAAGIAGLQQNAFYMHRAMVNQMMNSLSDCGFD